MNILLTNDDGIDALGIKTLREVLLENNHNVFMIAPDHEKSAMSHSITVAKPFRIKEISRNCYSINGSPADCVRVALSGFIKEKIDLLFSGINDGPNFGIYVHFSGTVAAAKQGCLYYIPSIALSSNEFGKPKHYKCISQATIRILNTIKLENLKNGIFLNINFPNKNIKEFKGIKYTKISNFVFKETLVERKDMAGFPYYWLEGKILPDKNELDSDKIAIKNNYISITPMTIDMTDYQYLSNLEKNHEEWGDQELMF